MAAGRPARSLWQEITVIDIANENPTRLRLLLEMAFQTEGGVPLGQHPLIDGAVRRVTREAAFAHRFMFENKWAALHGVALETGFVLAEQTEATALE